MYVCTCHSRQSFFHVTHWQVSRSIRQLDRQTERHGYKDLLMRGLQLFFLSVFGMKGVISVRAALLYFYKKKPLPHLLVKVLQPLFSSKFWCLAVNSFAHTESVSYLKSFVLVIFSQLLLLRSGYSRSTDAPTTKAPSQDEHPRSTRESV